MDQERSHIRAILRKYHFYRHPTESVIQNIFGNAVSGYLQGYVTRTFLGILAEEILLTNVRAKRRFLNDADLFARLLAAAKLYALRFDPEELSEIHTKLMRYEKRRSRGDSKRAKGR